jgi:hypothetical protein
VTFPEQSGLRQAEGTAANKQFQHAPALRAVAALRDSRVIESAHSF